MRLRLPLTGLFLLSFAVAQIWAQTAHPAPNTRADAISTLAATDTESTPDGPVVATSWSNAEGSGTSVTVPASEPICGITHLGTCIRNLGQDDVGIFTSPLRLQRKDVYWLAPLGASTGLLFAYDTDIEQQIGVDPGRTDTANKIADFGSFYATGAESAGIYFLGLARGNPKLTETGRLAAEAVIDSGGVTLATKLVSNRQRPLQGDRQGDFWANGTSSWQWDSSFPSDHSTASMALARVIAGEYPHWYVVIPAYGFAEAVGVSRIMANQHFASDVLVGQAIGFLTGTYVLNHRSLYRGGRRRSLAARLLTSVSPMADVRTHSFGASMQISLR